MHYFYIVYITIDSVVRMKKQIFTSLFRRIKCKIKKMKIFKFINTELKSESESEL